MKKQNATKFLFLAPFMLSLLLFWVIPLFTGLGISFTDWDFISPEMSFVGLENYVDIFTDPDFSKALWNTIVFSLGTIIPSIVLGLCFALVLQKKFTGSSIYQMLIFSPWITPAVAVSLVWSWIFEPSRGYANHLLEFLGLPPLEWLHSSETAMLGIIIFTVWKSIGWTMIFYMGALGRVPKSIYEAATLDGCNSISKFFHITLPMISPTTYFLTVVNLISAIQVFDQIEVMTQGGPGGSTSTLLYLYYERAFQNFQMGAASAVAMVILFITVVLSIIGARMAKQHVHYE
ncbi:MAG: carbohydrate ABC transporter permease [Alkaliphilus sp.]